MVTKRMMGLAIGATVALTSMARAGLVNGSFESPSVGGGFVTIPDGTDALPGWDVLGAPSGDPVISSIDHIDTFWEAAPDGGVQSLDMNGLSYGVIGQTLTSLAAGQTYDVQFAMSGNPGGTRGVKSLQVDVLNLPVASDPLNTGSRPFVPVLGVDDTLTTLGGVAPADINAEGLYTFDTLAEQNSNFPIPGMEWTLHNITFVAPASGTVYLQFTSRTVNPDPAYTASPSSPFGPALDAVSVVPVPLPTAAGVGFSMLAGVGLMAGFRKRFRRSARIAG